MEASGFSSILRKSTTFSQSLERPERNYFGPPRSNRKCYNQPHPGLISEIVVTRLLFGLALAALTFLVFVIGLTQTQAADPPESPRVKAIREKVLPTKLKLETDKKMLQM